MDPARLPIHLLVVGSEVATVVLAILALYGLFRVVWSRLSRLPLLAGRSERPQAVRRSVKIALWLAGATLCVAILAANAVLLYRGVDLLEFTLRWLREIPPRFWLDLGLSFLKVVGLILGAMLVLRILRRALRWATEWAKRLGHIKANDEAIEAFSRSLAGILTASTWLLVVGLGARLLALPPTVADGILIVLRVYLTIAVGLLIVKGLDAVIDSVEALCTRYVTPGRLQRVYDRLLQLVPLAKRCLEYIVYVYVATLVALQVEFISALAEHGPRVVRVIGIFFLSRVVIEVANLGVDELLTRRKDLPPAKQQQRLTFAPLIRSLLKYLIYFGAAVLILGELGVNPTPILAGAGVVGLAVGLGAQNLINDVVSGFFILFENHYLVGDFVETGGARGVVEAIDLRTTQVRNPNGQLHILRNGQIGEVVNHSKGFTHAVVEVGVAYESDLTKVFRVLGEAGERLAGEEADVLEPTTVQGLQEFGESELLIRTVTRVRPGRHMQVERRFRTMIKEAFDREGIEIPYARRVLIVKREDGVERLAEALAGRAHPPKDGGIPPSGG